MAETILPQPYEAPTWNQIRAALQQAERVREWCRGAGCSPAWLFDRDGDAYPPYWAHSLLRGMGLEVAARTPAQKVDRDT